MATREHKIPPPSKKTYDALLQIYRHWLQELVYEESITKESKAVNDRLAQAEKDEMNQTRKKLANAKKKGRGKGKDYPNKKGNEGGGGGGKGDEPPRRPSQPPRSPRTQKFVPGATKCVHDRPRWNGGHRCIMGVRCRFAHVECDTQGEYKR